MGWSLEIPRDAKQELTPHWLVAACVSATPSIPSHGSSYVKPPSARSRNKWNAQAAKPLEKVAQASLGHPSVSTTRLAKEALSGATTRRPACQRCVRHGHRAGTLCVNASGCFTDHHRPCLAAFLCLHRRFASPSLPFNHPLFQLQTF